MTAATDIAARRACEWREEIDLDMGGTFETECDNMFILNDGTLEQNRMRFCPYCGGRIVKGDAT